VNLSRFVWALALALLLLVTLVASTPARVLGWLLPPEQVIMQGFAGTLWQGSASRVLLRLPAGYLHLGTVRWSLQPLSLLLFSPRLALSSAWGSQTLAGELQLRGQRDLDVLNLEGQVAADLLRHFAPVSITGTLALQVEELQLRDGLPYSGDGRLVWQQAGWQSPRGPVPLGTYALEFHQLPGEALLGEVVTVSGPLQANGGAQLQARHYQLDIYLSGEESLDEQLRNMLTLIAVPEGAGFRVKLEGDF
jgi:hypothetical protein